MSAEWAIGILTIMAGFMLAVINHFNGQIKELRETQNKDRAAHQELANRVNLECVTYERLEKIIQQSLGVLNNTLIRLETDLADLKPIKEVVIRLETKLGLTS